MIIKRASGSGGPWCFSKLGLLAAVPVLVVVRIALVSVVVAVGLRVGRQDVHLLSGCVYGSAGRGISGLQRDYVEPADRSVDERARRTWGVSARIRVAGLHLSGRGFRWGGARRRALPGRPWIPVARRSRSGAGDGLSRPSRCDHR